LDTDIDQKRNDLEVQMNKAKSRDISSAMQYGTDDCLLWLADIYLPVLGVDLAADFRGQYDCQERAMELLGWRGVPGALINAAKKMSWDRINPLRAETGDLGMVLTPNGYAGVIKYGPFWIGRHDEGFAMCRAEYRGRPIVQRAWGIV